MLKHFLRIFLTSFVSLATIFKEFQIGVFKSEFNYTYKPKELETTGMASNFSTRKL